MAEYVVEALSPSKRFGDTIWNHKVRIVPELSKAEARYPTQNTPKVRTVMIGSRSRVRHTIIELFVKLYLPLYKMKLRTQRYLAKKRMKRETTREGRWIQDLEYMASQLRRRHKNLFQRSLRKSSTRPSVGSVSLSLV